MRAVNHALTGAVIGLAVDNPVIAMPASFLSHFVCDMIPHYGPADKSTDITSKGFKISLLLDAFLCFLLVLLLFIAKPHNWIVVSVCAFLAASPDFLWFRAYRLRNAGEQPKPSKLEKILADIQWFERPSGALVEVIWFILFSYLIYSFIV